MSKVMFVKEALGRLMIDLKFSLWRTVCRFFYLPFHFLARLWFRLTEAFVAILLFVSFLNVLKPSGLTVESFLKVCGTYFTGVSVENAFGAFLTVNVIWYLVILFLTIFVLLIDIFVLMFGHATYCYKVLCFYRVLKETEEPMFFAREKVTDETTSEETEETNETKSEETSSEETKSEETSSK
mgnify:CR=1 FL=1